MNHFPVMNPYDGGLGQLFVYIDDGCTVSFFSGKTFFQNLRISETKGCYRFGLKVNCIVGCISNCKKYLNKADEDGYLYIGDILRIMSFNRKDLVVTLINAKGELLDKTFKVGEKYGEVLIELRKNHVSLAQECGKAIAFDKFDNYQIYSVEEKGSNSILFRGLEEEFFEDWSWSIDEILFEELDLWVDFIEKQIRGGFSKMEECGGGRRTSNGWEDKYRYYDAKFGISFDNLRNLKDYLWFLPQTLKYIKGNIDKDPQQLVPSVSSCKMEIRFIEPIKFLDIRKVLHFKYYSRSYVKYI